MAVASVKRFYTVNEIAGMYGLTPRALRDMCVRGVIRASKIGKGWKVEASELERLYKHNSNRN